MRGTPGNNQVDALRALAAIEQGGLAAPSSSFVYQPGGAAKGNVFTDFPSLVTAANRIPGLKWVLFDGTFTGGVVHIPAGTWDTNNWIIYGNTAATGFIQTIVFDEGAAWTFAVQYWNSVSIENSSTVAPFTFSGGRGVFLVVYEAFIFSDAGKAPIFHFAATAGSGNTLIGVQEYLIGDDVTPVIQVDAPITIEVQLHNSSALGVNATIGTGRIDLGFDSDTAEVGAPQLAGLVKFPQSKGQFVTYNAAIVANWSGTNPSSISNALDRIAAKITPIP